MALTETPQKDESFQAVPFDLPATDGNNYTFENIKGENGTVIFFICNHCPYVIAVIDRLVKDAKMLQEQGFGVAAIMPNDTEKYPADSFENMNIFAEKHGFTFPYLIDESQRIAQAYGAVCTPDIFGFDSGGALQYRGRLDSAGKDDAGPDTKRELVEAMQQISETGTGPAQQFPSMGCSIKWKE